MKDIAPKQSILSRGSNFFFGGLAALGLFVAIPLIQAIGDVMSGRNEINTADFALPPPPLLEVALPPPPEQEEEEEDIELEKEPPKLSLDQLELALNPGAGDVMGGVVLDLGLNEDSLGLDEMIFDIAQVEEKPRALRQIEPVYPPTLKRQKIEGQVIIEFIIDVNGNVIAPVVKDSSHREFERPALDAIRRWKFTPGKNEGQVVKVRARLPMSFTIN